MNRRSFFSSLARAAAVAAVAPNIIASVRPDRMRWRKSSGLWIINPAWRTAEYQIDFCVWPGPDPDAVIRTWQTLARCEPWPADMGNTIRPVIRRRDAEPPPGVVRDLYGLRVTSEGTVVSPIV